MRKTIVATVAVALGMTSGLSGCKTAPKMPWSKTAAKTDAAESTALAHSAPALPADVAKEAESLASSSPSIEMSAPAATTTPTTGGRAAPYSAAPAFSATPSTVASTTTSPTSPSAYPTTGASAYSTTPPAPKTSIAAATPTPQSTLPKFDQAANLGSFSAPYNPSAVPPAKTVAKADPVTPPAATADRYGMSTAASTPPAAASAATPPATTAAAPAPSTGGDRYGNYQPKLPQMPSPPANVNLASTNPGSPTESKIASAYEAPITPTATAPAIDAPGDRYAASEPVTSNSSATNVTPASTVAAPVTQAAPVVASAPKYRPGGTSSYDGAATSQPAVEIASRPKAVEQQVPNVSAPGTTPEPSQAPRYR